MASLGDVQPPIALGALDGRYRGPWPPSSTTSPSRPSTGPACASRSSGSSTSPSVRWCPACGDSPPPRSPPARDCRHVRTRRHRRDGRHRAGHPARRQGSRVLPQEAAHHDRARSRRPGLAELIHFACTSEDINNLVLRRDGQGGGRPRSGCREAQGLVEATRDDGPRPARRAAARPHPRPAGDADDDGQGARRARPGGSSASSRGSRTPSSSASSTARPAPTARTSPPCPVPTGSRPPASSSKALGLTWNPLTTQIESHDWQASSTPTSPASTASCTTCAPTCGPTSRWATSRRCAARARSGRARCRTRSTRSASRTPRPTSRSATPCFDVLAATLVAERLQRDLTDSSMQRNIGTPSAQLLAIDNVCRGLAGLDAVPDRDGRRPRRELGGARRADPVGDAGPRGAGPGMEEPYERLKELDPRAGASDGLGLPEDVRLRLQAMTPRTYVGIARR
jgi:adenylosuccinate lyase